jgi:hypothetical protein
VRIRNRNTILVTRSPTRAWCAGFAGYGMSGTENREDYRDNDQADCHRSLSEPRMQVKFILHR